MKESLAFVVCVIFLSITKENMLRQPITLVPGEKTACNLVHDVDFARREAQPVVEKRAI